MRKTIHTLLCAGVLFQGSMNAASQAPSQKDKDIDKIFHTIGNILMDWYDKKATWNDWYGDESERAFHAIADERQKAAKIDPEMDQFIEIWLAEYNSPYFAEAFELPEDSGERKARLEARSDLAFHVSNIAPLLFSSRPWTEENKNYIARVITENRDKGSETVKQISLIRGLKTGRIRREPSASSAPSPLAGGGSAPAPHYPGQQFRLSQNIPAPSRPAPARPTAGQAVQRPADVKRQAASEQEQRAILKDIDDQFKEALAEKNLPGMERALQRFLEVSGGLDKIPENERAAFAVSMGNQIEAESKSRVMTHPAPCPSPQSSQPGKASDGAGVINRPSTAARPSVVTRPGLAAPSASGVSQDELQRVQRAHRASVPTASDAWQGPTRAVQPSFTQQKNYDQLLSAIKTAISQKNSMEIRSAFVKLFDEAKGFNQIDKNKIKDEAQEQVTEAKKVMKPLEAKLLENQYQNFLKELFK